MSARAIVAFACIAVGLPPGVTDLTRHGLAQAWTIASVAWRRCRGAWRRRGHAIDTQLVDHPS